MGFSQHLRNKFLAGIFAAIPVAVSALVIWTIEGWTRSIFFIDIPFVGIVLALLAIYLLGLLVTSLAGRYLLGVLDRLLVRVPGLSELYRAWKQVLITPGGAEGIFARVVLVQIETGSIHTLGFTSGEGIPGDPATTCVFIPHTPNVTTGRLYFVPLAQCRFLDMTNEEAFKILLSGGNYIPEAIGAATTGGAEHMVRQC